MVIKLYFGKTKWKLKNLSFTREVGSLRVKQLDMLRKEAHIKARGVSNSGSRERISPYRHPGLSALSNSNGNFEPTHQLAHPKPHP
jgi:hypothetical protein